MIPGTNVNIKLETKEQPSRTYKMHFEEESTKGVVDKLEAVKQAVFKILNTERYQYIMYSWDYGIETLDLYGEPVTWVIPELERRIMEALLFDSRIISVTDFNHDASVKGVIHTSFIVHTVFGDVRTTKEVTV